MRRDELAQAAEPRALVEKLRQPATAGKQADAHGGAVESVREATYHGHRIAVRTSYRIEVDGRPIEGHVGVSNDGQVHYEAVPNLEFASAIDLVRQLIDTFPEDFGPAAGRHDQRQGS
jgi:hypothetical protein